MTANNTMEYSNASDRIARFADALDEIQNATDAFTKFAHAPLARVCEYYWSEALNAQPVPPIVVVPHNQLVVYQTAEEVEPRLVHIDPSVADQDPKDNYAIAMQRISTPRLSIEVDRIANAPGEETINLFDTVIQDAVDSMVDQLAEKPAEDSEIIVTPLEGSISLDPNDYMKVSTYLYTLWGCRHVGTYSQGGVHA